MTAGVELPWVYVYVIRCNKECSIACQNCSLTELATSTANDPNVVEYTQGRLEDHVAYGAVELR